MVSESLKPYTFLVVNFALLKPLSPRITEEKGLGLARFLVGTL
jgi:hypothetical protein